ncbi:MAG TPA: transglutaminase family protein [Solirubrobacteraceae bacterium]|nr:transglutaminase family protein [Solirubrobacteraceae bacterium]
MSIRLSIEHKTIYRYDRPVQLGPQVVRLRPAPHCRTPILAYSLQVTPGQHFVNWQQDPFGNYLARFVFPELVRELAVTVDLVADMTVINPFDFFVDEAAEQWPFSYEAALAHDLAPYLAVEPGGALLDDWVASFPRTPMRTIDFLIAANRRVLGDVGYSVRMEPGVQTPDETLRRGIGSCRDSAWLLVQLLRRLGIAARFASGYLVQLVEDVVPGATLSGATEDFTDLHAWTEAYLPGAGWIGLDPTSGLLTGEGHIPLACTATPGAAAAISGVVGQGETTMEYSNVVRRIHEDPRVTLPYSPAQWERIDALGEAVDVTLTTSDARLTMGGEPTFVSLTDMEGAEWNIAADGPTKRPLAIELVKRIAPDFAPGALIQHSQGKWYPGEPLPRWQINVHWRSDGTPLWQDPALLADPLEPGSATTDSVAALTAAICAGLGLPNDVPVAGYEDPVGRLWAEARLPGGDPPQLGEIDPRDAPLADAIVRAAITSTLDDERGEPRGWAIPLRREPGDGAWQTGRWALRRGHLFLIAGDSPMGLRLPLDSLTWTPPPPPELERSRSTPVAPLPDGTPPTATPTAQAVEPPPITALCVELRNGTPHVFLPPITDAEDAVELVGIVEAAAGRLELPIVVEGYPLPGDRRLQQFGVAADPGVIEVNIHPSESWAELVARTTTLAAEARRAGLGTEKFALDGTHAGTGGGSHLTLGGATPPDSPFLRRPDLLRSLVTFWQHHPSLSYLFSGRFVGPTSQAPRVDEARHESLYELEIAFAEMDRLAADGPPPPWQVDRLLRNLLADLTGNTHRAEFCIDKLFSPESERGRLGVVELRGFEMPPHPQMALVQALLVRALVARFWNEPYSGPLVRWGTELHDRFLLPWWVEADIADVLDDLARDGFAFEHEWLEPFLAFRFPRIGVVHVDGLTLELRDAIEPWNVLAEDLGAGTSRYVDSSLERLQVRVDGLTDSRHAVTCNGVLLPLQPTATPGTFVAGVRFRAWQPPSALHPTIGIHAPLHFDVVDRWSKRSLGGCAYHVVHPGGLAYDTFPVNANEAEARRASRFSAIGHTPGAIELVEDRRGGEYPRTLDLRRAPMPAPAEARAPIT